MEANASQVTKEFDSPLGRFPEPLLNYWTEDCGAARLACHHSGRSTCACKWNNTAEYQPSIKNCDHRGCGFS